MKAICVERFSTWVGNDLIVIEKGDIVEYSAEDSKFFVKGVKFTPTGFFAHFKVTEGNERISYSDFEYILCNSIFRMAVLYPEEYSGVRHLIIQDWNHATVMLTVNREENDIRVSYPDKQGHYTSYEDALEGIRSFAAGGRKQESEDDMAKRLLGIEDVVEGVGLAEAYVPDVDLTLEELVTVIEEWKETSSVVSCETIIELLRSRKKGSQAVEPELACGYCNNAKVDSRLSDDNDYSASCIGGGEDDYRLMLLSGNNRPLRLVSEKWRGGGWGKLTEYFPKYCPECGREIVEYKESVEE